MRKDGGAGERRAAPKRTTGAVYAKRDTVGVATRVTLVALPSSNAASSSSSSSFDPRTSTPSFSTAKDASVSSPEQYESESRDRERGELDDAHEPVAEFVREESSTSSSFGDVALGSTRRRSLSPPAKGSWTPTEARKSSESFAERAESGSTGSGLCWPSPASSASVCRSLVAAAPNCGSHGVSGRRESAGTPPVEAMRSRLGRREDDSRLLIKSADPACPAWQHRKQGCFQQSGSTEWSC